MPRGRKKKENLTIDQRIEQINDEIGELNATLKAKKAELKRLEKEKSSENLKLLADAVAESGMSVTEVLELLKK